MRVTVPTTRAQVDELEDITTAPVDAAQGASAEQTREEGSAEPAQDASAQ